MISVLTAWEDIDEFPTANDVSILSGGYLAVQEPVLGNEGMMKQLALYAPGAWQKVEYDEASMQLTCFLMEHQLMEKWVAYGKCDEQ
jgi:hypothetical protein